MLFNHQWVFKENSARSLTILYLRVILTTGKKRLGSRVLFWAPGCAVKSPLRNLPAAVVEGNGEGAEGRSHRAPGDAVPAHTAALRRKSAFL